MALGGLKPKVFFNIFSVGFSGYSFVFSLFLVVLVIIQWFYIVALVFFVSKGFSGMLLVFNQQVPFLGMTLQTSYGSVFFEGLNMFKLGVVGTRGTSDP